MRLHRALAGLFVAASLVLTTLLPFGPTSSRPLLAASGDCGGYSGPLCSETESCVWYVFARICTTKYTYWKPADKEDDGSSTQPKQPG